MDINQLARTRALCAAKVEDLQQRGKPSSGAGSDREETLAFAQALKEAKREYEIAEQDYQRATCTLMPEELAELTRKDRAA